MLHISTPDHLLKFSPADLSEIARKLDVLEEQYNTESDHDGSKNMDDTGPQRAIDHFSD
jgi:hypothetical protein